MTIKTEKRLVDISLRYWRGGWNAGYEPDCFQDLEPNFPVQFPEREENEDGFPCAILCPEKELVELIDFWSEECDLANEGETGDVLEALTDAEIENGDGWNLFVNELEVY